MDEAKIMMIWGKEGILRICHQIVLGHSDFWKKDWKDAEQNELGGKEGKQIAATYNRVQNEEDSSRYI